MQSSSTTRHSGILILLIAFTVLRLLVIPTFGLGVDEAHYVLYGRYLALSYFDHPPLVGWLHRGFAVLFGDGLFAARIGAVIAGILATLGVYLLLLRACNDRRGALLGAFALNTSFLFNALFMMMMPDTLLLIVQVPLIFAVLAIERHNSVRNWLLLAVLLGLAGLTKYTAVLFLVPVAGYFIVRRRFDLLLTPKLIPAFLLALAMIAPVIVWNMNHEWASFAYQGDHVLGAAKIDWNDFGQSLAAQFGAYSPLLFPVAFFGLFKALRSKNEVLFLSGLFGLTMIVFFTYASLYKRALPHWTALFYQLFIPIGCYSLYRVGGRWRRYLYGALAFSLLLSLVAYAELSLKFLPLPDYKSIHRDIYGFDTIMREANTRLRDPDREAIAVTNWSVASRALYYNGPYRSDVFLIDKRTDQFDLWQNGTPIGRDLLFVNTHFFNKDIARKMQCDSVEPAGAIDIELHGNKVNTVAYVWCRNFQGRK
jgi:4-amino-4-deoxy-L-arabinose transferase-like glycosyltransferase